MSDGLVNVAVASLLKFTSDKENSHEGFRYRIIRQADHGRREAADYAEGGSV